uniref:Swiss Army Knife protein DSP-PTPase phosphatase domain-containing protein n=1 Tax=Castor canadensis TaxID=51338 RepID=A0A8C0WG73_CASCN
MGVKPPNFSWVLPGRLAGLALPRLPSHYQFLLDLGVRHLVSLTERGPPHSDSCPGLTLHRLRIQTSAHLPLTRSTASCRLWTRPTPGERPWECTVPWASAATGTMLACYLVKEHGLAAERRDC